MKKIIALFNNCTLVSALLIILFVFVNSCDNAAGGGDQEDPVDPSLPTLIYTANTLPGGKVGQVYSANVGTAELPPEADPAVISYTLVSGSLPAGLTLSSSGTLSGTPAAGSNGTRTFGVRASADGYNSKTAVFSLTITAAPAGPQLSVSQDVFRFNAEGGWIKTPVIVTTDDPEWDAVSDQDWCEVYIYHMEPLARGYVDIEGFDISVFPNTSDTGRTAIITVTAGAAVPVIVTVMQAGQGAYLEVSPTVTVGFPKEGGTSGAMTVSTSYSEWQTSSSQAWCTVSKAGSSFTITASGNSGGPRTAEVTVSTDEYIPYVVISVVQDGTTGVLAVGSYYYSDGSYSFALNTSKTCVGIVFSVNDRNGMVVSLDESGTTQWGTNTTATYASSSIDGKINLAMIKNQLNWQTVYPPFAWCAAKGESWYLPAYDEMYELMRSRATVNSKIAAAGGTALVYDFYWTSTEYTSNSTWAWFYSTTLGTMMASGKNGNAKARAIFGF